MQRRLGATPQCLHMIHFLIGVLRHGILNQLAESGLNNSRAVGVTILYQSIDCPARIFLNLGIIGKSLHRGSYHLGAFELAHYICCISVDSQNGLQSSKSIDLNTFLIGVACYCPDNSIECSRLYDRLMKTSQRSSYKFIRCHKLHQCSTTLTLNDRVMEPFFHDYCNN